MERRHFVWDGCFNARDLGGLPASDGQRTRHGVLIRADTVCSLSEAGRRQVLADGVKTVLDLRSAIELEKEPNPFAVDGGITYLHRPFNDAAIEARIRDMPSPPERYVAMIEANGERVAAIVDTLARAPRAVLFHCFGGRDRTGIVTALALRVARVPDDVIERDFVLSDERLAPKYERWRGEFSPEDRQRFDRSIAEARASIRAALRRVDEGWGGVDGYLREHGLAEESIDRLRADLLTTDSP